MTDDNTTPRFLDRLAEDVAAILDGREPEGDPEPTDAGVHLGTALRIHAQISDFQISWDPAFAGIANLSVPWSLATWVQSFGLDLRAYATEDGRFLFLLDENECHALAGAIEQQPTARTDSDDTDCRA